MTKHTANRHGKSKKPYIKPTVKYYGRIAAVTGSQAGSGPDVGGMMMLVSGIFTM